jgi:hypothetical protein
MSADEQIAAITDISILQSVDPREFSVVVRILTKGLQPITTAFNISTI